MESLIVTYGLAAVFVLMTAESACIPVPSELTMLLGGALAAGAVSGPHPNLAAVIAVGTLGNIVGSYAAWLLGRYGGRPALHRWARYLRVRPGDIDRAERWFISRGAASVFWARLLPGIRTFISLPAGMAGMGAVRFGCYTVAGCLPWTAGLAVAGYFIGANWRSADAALRGPSYGLAGIVLIAAAAYLVVHHRRRRTARERQLETSTSS